MADKRLFSKSLLKTSQCKNNFPEFWNLIGRLVEQKIYYKAGVWILTSKIFVLRAITLIDYWVGGLHYWKCFCLSFLYHFETGEEMVDYVFSWEVLEIRPESINLKRLLRGWFTSLIRFLPFFFNHFDKERRWWTIYSAGRYLTFVQRAVI